MGDRTYYRLSLPTGLSNDQLHRAASAFTQDEWTVEEVEQLTRQARQDAVWVDIEERLVGECREAAEAVLAALAGQVAFAVTEDPKYEWLGTVCRYDPARGMHETECDAEGEALLSAGVFKAISRAADGDPVAVVEQLHQVLGIEWSTP